MKEDLKPFIDGIDDVKRIFGKDYTFHDAEIDEIHIIRAEDAATILMWTNPGVADKNYNITMRFEGLQDINLSGYDVTGGSAYVYDVQFEKVPYYPELVKVIIDGTGIEISCRHISISVELALLSPATNTHHKG